jgi:hypothetical protein
MVFTPILPKEPETDPVKLRARIDELENELIHRLTEAYEKGYGEGHSVGYGKGCDDTEAGLT